MPEPEKLSCLLPDDVKFIHYDVELEPDFEKFEFRGAVRITCQVMRPTMSITLHAAGLTIHPAMQLELENVCGNDVVLYSSDITFNESQEQMTIRFDRELPTQVVYLKIAYWGTLTDSMRGFYRSSYVAADGSTKYLAVTQCESTDARRVLPCGDEPALKATFAVTLIVPETMRALSNMPVHWDVPNGGSKRKVQFGVTPKMSSYLLAFVVGDLDFIEAELKTGTRVRVYTTPGKSEQGRFALETACRALEFYNEYFGIPYPLPKLDMVAIPDFAAGAMENWGLVTYRENALLIDPEHSSAAAYKRVAEVVCHELAHMWFGNLVTMTWWTHLWLNEGFATWAASYAMDHLFPDWNVWNHFVADEFDAGLHLDALRSTHPIEVPVSHPDEISQIFDDIAYAKGASVIRMLHEELGAQAFRTGLQNYLTRHAYDNASTDDLWASLSQASGQDVAALMSSWTKQPGFPMVSAIIDINDERSIIHVQQERFIADGSPLQADERQQQWKLPRTLKNVIVDFEKINLGQSSFVRVRHSSSQLKALGYAVESGILPPLDRYGIVSDAHALTRAGKVNMTDLLLLLASYRYETNYTVWTAVLAALDDIRSLVEDDDVLVYRFKDFERRILTRIFDNTGISEGADDSQDMKMLRGLILGAYGAAGYRPAIFQARELFMDHFSGLQSLNPNLRAATYKLIAREANWDYYTKLIVLLEKATLQEERVRLLQAMGQVRDDAIVQDLLTFIFERKCIRSGDIVYVIPALGSHPNGRRLLWNYIRTNWDVVNEQYGSKGTKMMSRILSGVISGHSTTNAADMFRVFFDLYPVPSASATIAQSIETVRARAAWRDRDREKIAAFLEKF